MANPEKDATTTEPQVLFRAGKKRKAYIRRVQEDEDAADNVPSIVTEELPKSASQTEDQDTARALSVAEALRLRNARKPRLRGVGFSAPGSAKGVPGDDDDNGERSLVVRGEETRSTPSGGITRRFAPQTGLVGELVNKHL